MALVRLRAEVPGNSSDQLFLLQFEFHYFVNN